MFLLYPEVTLFESVPLVRAIGVNGPQLLNARQHLNVVILDALFPTLELRVGVGEAAELVTITRGKGLRTITCPDDGEDCPHWPDAAPYLGGGHHDHRHVYQPPTATPRRPSAHRAPAGGSSSLLALALVGGGFWVLATYGKKVVTAPVESIIQPSWIKEAMAYAPEPAAAAEGRRPRPSARPSCWTN